MKLMRLVASLAVAAAWSSPMTAQAVYYEGGLSMSSGSYIFTERTTSWSLSNGLAINAGPFTIRGTVPVFRQNTSLLTSSATGLLPTGGSSSGAVADSSAARKGGGGGPGGGGNSQLVSALPSFQETAALAVVDPVDVPTTAVTGYRMTVGDPFLNVSAVLAETGRTSVIASVGAKVPLNDTTNYGTGEWDFGGSVSISQGVSPNVLLGADFSYWRFGDLPELDLRDGIMGSANIAYLGTAGWGCSAAFTGARSIVEGFADSYMVTGSITRLAGVAALSMNLAAGLTEMAPDFIAGLSWRIGIQ